MLKPLKIAIFGPNLRKRGVSMDHTKFIFLAEMTKADHKLSKTFLFYQNIICFDRVMHVLLFCGDVFLLKESLPAITAVGAKFGPN